MGLLSVRQDRRLAQQEAQAQAGTLVTEVADRFDSELRQAGRELPKPTGDLIPQPNRPAFCVDNHGRLLFPPAVPSLSEPAPLDAGALKVSARPLWRQARAGLYEPQASASTIRAWRQFLATQPPPRFAAAATYQLALAFTAQGAYDQARSLFARMGNQFTSERTESGVPYATLALWQRVRLCSAEPTVAPAVRSTLLEDLCSNLVFTPSPLTPVLLKQVREPISSVGFSKPTPGKERGSGGLPRAQNPSPQDHGRPAQRTATSSGRTGTHSASVERWRDLWTEEQRARALYTATIGILVSTNGSSSSPSSVTVATNAVNPWDLLPPFFWVNGPTEATNQSVTTTESTPVTHSSPWLLSRVTESMGWFVGRPQTEVQHEWNTAVHRLRPPAYLGFGAQVAGRSVGFRGERPLATHATAVSQHPGARSPSLTVTAYLADPAQLYAQVRRRTRWLAALVLMATGVAAFGLLAAYRAFARQLRLSEMKSNFVSSVSHELRAPIASVRLLAEGLDRGKVVDEPRRRAYFRLIVQECRRLSSLIENVLDFSRIDQGRKLYDLEPIDLGGLVRQTVEVMTPYAAEREVRLAVQIEAELPGLDADGKALQQALVNLIDNAVKHSPTGQTVTVGIQTLPPVRGKGKRFDSRTVGFTQEKLRAEVGLPAVASVGLFVADHGPGIPLAEQERIFEPFYRRGSELRRETTGVGIGLSIVKHVAEAHGGRVRVQSAPSQGSRFTIVLPLAGSPSKSPSPHE